jgi:glycosyltransferase involved in cell wall biosynthesis
MDVALVASLVSPVVEREANGPHRVIADIARGLTARGHRTTVYAAAGSRVAGIDLREIAVPASVASARIIPGRPQHEEPQLRSAFGRLFAAVEHAGHDVVLQHAFDAAAISASVSMPILHVLHLPPLVPAIVEAARASQAPLAAVSAASSRDWSAAGVSISRVLPNGVPDPGSVRDLVEPAALVAGRISPEKGTAVAIRAARAAGLEPWLVGDPYDREYFEVEVRPFLPWVRYFGAISRTDLMRLMARASVAVMPVAWSEPFGLVAAEAQMAGCPVVAYRRGALPEVVEDGTTGVLVDPNDETGLAEAINRARELDRSAVRSSALRRLGIGPMLDRYEAAMASVWGL